MGMCGNRVFAFCFVLICGGFALSCSTVPPLEQATGGITVREIVQRVKCELSDAFDKKTEELDFLWVKSWTTKVDLTLQANAQTGINPGASLIYPLQNAFPNVGPSTKGGTTISAVKQQFAFGASATLNGQAIRTELVSFSLSLEELKVWRKSLDAAAVCDMGSGIDLAGGLGLKQWVDESLSPVSADELQAGSHPPPSSSKPVTGSPPSHAPEIGATLKDQALQTIKDAKQYSSDADKLAAQAALSAKQAYSSVYGSPYFPVLNPEYKRLSLAYVTLASQQAEAAKMDAESAKQDVVSAEDAAASITDVPAAAEADKIALQKVTDLAKHAWTVSQDAKQQADAASKNTSYAKQRKPDPPIDSLAHSVQFILTYGASLSPSWTFVNLNGPNANLAAASGVRTHTLNIALGPRGPGDSKTSPEAVRALQTLTIQQSGPH
jgi:hypothetical protein